MVYEATSFLYLHPMSYRSRGRCDLAQGRFTGLLQHPISLPPESCMQRKHVPMLYERAASQVPSLYVCPIPVNGNTANKIPHCFQGMMVTSDGTKIPKKAGQGACYSKLTCGCGAMGRFSVPVEQGSASCGNALEEGAGIQGTRS